jgi:hypothetical protein
VIETTGNALWVSPLTFAEASTPGTGGFVDSPNQRLQVQHISPITNPQQLSEVPVRGTGSHALRLGDVSTVVENHQPLIGHAVSVSMSGFSRTSRPIRSVDRRGPSDARARAPLRGRWRGSLFDRPDGLWASRTPSGLVANPADPWMDFLLAKQQCPDYGLLGGLRRGRRVDHHLDPSSMWGQVEDVQADEPLWRREGAASNVIDCALVLELMIGNRRALALPPPARLTSR